MRIVRYKLTLNIVITKQEATDNHGSPVDTDYLESLPNDAARKKALADVRWMDAYRDERLTITEETVLGGLDFLGAMRVLGELHDAIQGLTP